VRSAGSDRAARKQAIEDLLRLAVTPDEFAPAIARASALGELATAGVTAATKTAKQILDNPNEHPVVRAAAINLFMGGPNISPDMIRKALLPYIDDESRLIRTEAARVLVTSGAYQTLRGSEKSRVDLALREVRDAIMMASDRAGAHMGWAMLREGQGRYAEAIEAYETAMRVEPGTTGPRTNLASLLERLASQSQGLQAAQLMSQVAQLRAAELPLLGRDASLAPDNAQVQYRYGLALYLAGRMTEAMERLNRATELAPDVPDFRQARDLLKEKLQQQ
jgi:tetratricopeptide (TPR) repeat protein